MESENDRNEMEVEREDAERKKISEFGSLCKEP